MGALSPSKRTSVLESIHLYRKVPRDLTDATRLGGFLSLCCAGLMAYLLLHTSTPTLEAVYALIRHHDAHRKRARTSHNTFAVELERICVGCGKPLRA